MGFVSNVVSALKAAGIRTEAAYPGRRMMALTGPVAAVCLEQVDYAAQTTCVQVEVMCPAAQGGAVCEGTAETAGKAAAALGAECVQGPCRFNGDTDCYCVSLTVTFCTAQAAASAFSVTQGGVALDGAVGFKAWREADADNGITLANAAWQIRLEEEFSPGQREKIVTTDPFQLTVTRTAGVEVFTGCTWTQVKREDTPELLRQTRTGTAGSRSYTAK